MSRKHFRAMTVSFLSFLITFLSFLLFLKLSMKGGDAKAHSSSWFELFVSADDEPLYVYPTNSEWVPPSWYPQASVEEMWALSQLEKEAAFTKGPKLHSRAALVFDVDRGEVLYEKNADSRWPVASLTKVVSALALAAEEVSLDRLSESYCLDRSIKPGLPGATTRFKAGRCTSGWDLLGSALVSSDNGGAFALPKIADLPPGVFVDRMNTVASDLNMTDSEFADPAGVGDENLSTARDITRATIAAAFHPTISIPVSAPSWYTQHDENSYAYRRFSTNRMSHNPKIEVLAAKTGYTDTARSCFTTVFRKNGRTLAITTLGAYSSGRRWKDVRKLTDWAMRN